MGMGRGPLKGFQKVFKNRPTLQKVPSPFNRSKKPSQNQPPFFQLISNLTFPSRFANSWATPTISRCEPSRYPDTWVGISFQCQRKEGLQGNIPGREGTSVPRLGTNLLNYQSRAFQHLWCNITKLPSARATIVK